MKNNKKGFTLIELLVVIAIIGLLSTLAVVALNSARLRSRDAKRVADIRQIQTALELGFSEVGAYPYPAATAENLGEGTANVRLCQTGAGSQSFNAAATCAGTTYMGLVPRNPTPGGLSYSYLGTGTVASPGNTGTASSYRINFALEGATGQLGSGSNCASPSGIVSGSSC